MRKQYIEHFFFEDQSTLKISKNEISHIVGKNPDDQFIKTDFFKKNYAPTDLSFLEIDNGHYIPIDGGKLITSSEKNIIHSQVNGEYDTSFPIEEYKNDIVRDTKHFNSIVIDLTSLGSALFSFWLLDALPKLKLLEKYISSNDSISIIVNHNSDFVKESLETFGYCDVNLIRRNGSKFNFSADKLIVPKPIRKNRFTPKWALNYIRSSFTGELGSSREVGNRVYISRQKSHGRKIINHDDFDKIIGKYNFKTVFAEDLSLQEMVKIVCHSEIIISPHGAGLSNTLFSPTNTKVIELFGAHYTTQFRMMSQTIGHDYYCLDCRDETGYYYNEIDRKNHSISELNRRDFTVDIDRLDNLISFLI